MTWWRWKSRILTLIAVVLFLLWMFPIFWMVSNSFKTEKEIVTIQWLPSKLTLANYATMFERAKIARWFVNSVVVSTLATVGVVITSLLAGYSLGRLEFPGKRVVFLITLSGFMIPFQAIMIPLFLILRSLKMANTYQGLILPGIASSVSVFILAQYFKGIDREYEEAARLDGASELQILMRVMCPMAIPAVITVAIMTFTGAWNDFVWPLILAQKDDMYTLPVGLVTLAGSDVNIRYGPIMASNVIASLPVFIIYFFFQRYIIRGVTVGDLK